MKIFRQSTLPESRTTRTKYRLLHNDFANDYAELLKKSDKATMEIKRLRCLALEILKTVNNLNPYYMKEIFSKTTNRTHRLLDINFNQDNTTRYGSNSLRSLGPHIWNYLPLEIKEETEYAKFRNYMSDWFGLKCKCDMCSFLNVQTMLISFDYDLGFDPFNYVTVLCII